MAEPVLRLDHDRVSVRPGGQASVTLTITNPGTIVEGYRLEVLGLPKLWAEIVPEEVSVFPQQDATVTVVFSPPSGPGAPGGDQVFGVLARSTVDPLSSAAVEGDVSVGTVFGIQAKLVPVTSSGRWQGRHTITLDNWGNSAARVQLTASNADEALGFYLRPDVVDLPLGGRATVRLAVKSRRPFLRGAPVRLPFQVVGVREDAPRGPVPPIPYADPGLVVVDGALNQRPILSRAFVTVMALLLVGVVALGVYLYKQPGAAAEEELGERHIPEPPQGFRVKARTPISIELEWERSRSTESYKVEDLDPATGKIKGVQPPVPQDQTLLEIKELTPETTYCFRISAVSGVAGQPSEKVCGTTLRPPRTATPDPSGGGTSPPDNGGGSTKTTDSSPVTTPPETPGGGVDPNLLGDKWIAVISFDLDISEDTVQTAAKDYTAKTGDPSITLLYSRDYPNFTFLSGNRFVEKSIVAYVGPYDDRPTAQEICDAVRAKGVPRCDLAQPDRTSPGVTSPAAS